MKTSGAPDVISRRGELLAEMFLSELGATVTRPPFNTVDFLAFFKLEKLGERVIAVEVKSRETPVPQDFAVDASSLVHAAQLNIPTMLLVVDVKQNRIGIAWLDEYARQQERISRGAKVRVPLVDAETHKEEIRQHIIGATAVHA